MFFVKAKLSDEVTINTDITDENVYTVCPMCGKEHAVGDITELFRKGEFDLYSSSLYCRECAEKKLTDENSTKAVYEITTIWKDNTTTNDVYSGVDSVFEELSGLLPEINDIAKIEITGIIQ